MGFYTELCQATKTHQETLFELPFVANALEGRVSLEGYTEFLRQAYHHVKHTVPLLMATGSRLGPEYEWLRTSVGHYISEELGHQEWILSDIAACGGDAGAVRNEAPGIPCELMVSFAYDVVMRRNPIGFFGMVHVLEGTSVRGATLAAEKIREQLGLPETAFRYLTTHGDLDVDHVDFFASLMDRIEDRSDQRWILHCAEVFFELYGGIFRSLPSPARKETV